MGEKETTIVTKESKLIIEDYNNSKEGCAAILHSDDYSGTL